MSIFRVPAPTLLAAVALAAVVVSGSQSPSVAEQADRSAGREIAVVSRTAAGGEPARRATQVDGAADIRAWAAGAGVESMQGTLVKRYRAADLSEDESAWVTVVSVGCDVPPGVDVTVRGKRVLVDPQPVEEPLPECFAPVTSAALVAVRS
ncbi:MAG: hypothetical protein F2667_00970 [Actinobacteria bacterium]|uniref:Unannotated protein n=1 Tax=freshwater metagenome TaxID=449393 RepID=A0A6J6NKH4_9ZZZZ|nr:hypothetical protein [Actinomycetota bacterium]